MFNTVFGKSALRLSVLTAAIVTAGFAQMGGGSGMRGGPGSGMPGTGSGATSTMSGAAGMGSMNSGPTVGVDGTAYVIRQTTVTTGSQKTIKNELVAINPTTGKANWALEITGTMISDPVLAKDGTILLTVSEPNPASSASSALLVVAPSTGLARVQARTAIDADMLSLPVMTPDGQTIYVIATDMPGMTAASRTPSPGTSSLYAFIPGTGVLKFKTQLR